MSSPTRLSRRAAIFAALTTASMLVGTDLPTPADAPRLLPTRPPLPPALDDSGPVSPTRPQITAISATTAPRLSSLDVPTVSLGATLTDGDYGVAPNDAGGGGAWRRHVTNYRTFFHAPTSVHILNWYFDIRNNGDANPNALANARALGCTPMLSLNTADLRLAAIASDAYRTTQPIATRRYNDVFYRWDADMATMQTIFTRMADGYAGQGTLLLRLNWEMNLNPTPGSPMRWVATPGSGNSPAVYRAAWQKIHGIFQSRHATNVKFVWCPNVREAGVTAGNLWDYYPGDQYVDYVGLDGYGYGTAPYLRNGVLVNRSYHGFEAIYRDSYDEIAARTDKPIIIGETGVYHFDYRAPDAQNPPIPTAAEWLDDAFLVQIPTHYPRIRAICYYNLDARWNGGETSPDWRVLNLAGADNDGKPNYAMSATPTRPPEVQETPPGLAWKPPAYSPVQEQAINDKVATWGAICRTPYYTRPFP